MDANDTPVRGAAGSRDQLAEPAATDIVYLGIVHASDGVRFVAHARSYTGVIGRVAEYVRARCAAHLGPEDAAEVQSLLDDDHADVAVELYFDSVGERWDRESLWVGMSEAAV